MIGSANRKTIRQGLLAASLAVAISGPGERTASAQTYGFASMQPGSINHTTSSAIARVLKEKGGLNTLVQATAGESVMIAIVGRGEADFAMANAPEIGMALANDGQPNLRVIGAGRDRRAFAIAGEALPLDDRVGLAHECRPHAEPAVQQRFTREHDCAASGDRTAGACELLQICDPAGERRIELEALVTPRFAADHEAALADDGQ